MPGQARKSAPRKTTARKPPAKAKNASVFDELRERARSAGYTQAKTRGPFILPLPDREPLEIPWPKLSQRLELAEAGSSGNYVTALRVLLGEHFLTVIEAFEQQGDDSELLLAGLQVQMLEHFMGPGALDVPGGSRAS